MNRHEGDRLIKVIQELMAEEGAASVRGGKTRPERPAPPARDQEKDHHEIGQLPKLEADFLERIFLEFKNRMIDELRLDPVLVQLITQQKEIEIIIEPRIVQMDGGTLRGRVARLVGQGWANEPRATSAFRTELTRTGNDPGGGGSLSTVLGEFVRDGFLVRAGDRWQKAPDLKVTEKVIEAR